MLKWLGDIIVPVLFAVFSMGTMMLLAIIGVAIGLDGVSALALGCMIVLAFVFRRRRR